jgi:protein O-GlcNAc transferase
MNGLSLVQQAQTEFEAGRYQNAAKWLEQAHTQHPDDAAIVVNRGICLQRLGSLHDAIACLESACKIDSKFALAWAHLGDALRELGDCDKAQKALSIACDLAPDLATPRVALALLMRSLGQVTQAHAALRHATQLEPAQADIWCNLALVLQDMGDIPQSVQALRHALALSPGHRLAQSNLLMALQYDAELDAQSLREAALGWGKSFLAGVLPLYPAGKRKLRVGYVSGDFAEHPVGRFFLEVLRAHDAEKFEIFCYANQIKSDALTQELASLQVHWRNVFYLTDGALQEQISTDQIDVLVDMSGHTAGNRLHVFAMRSAPVQFSWLGYFASTGLQQIDGAIFGEDQVPHSADSYFVEPVCRLDRVHFCYSPPVYAPPVAMRGTEPNPEVVFGSFNSVAKLNEKVIRLWARLLAQIPNSRLILKSRPFNDADLCDSFRQRFVQWGCKAEQLEFRGASAHAQMLYEYGDVDVALDPFPFSGCLTSCEALWMGVPVVTLSCERPVARQTLAILNTLGLQALVAQTPDIYIAICRALADNRSSLQALRASMRTRMLSSKLMDGAGLARALEKLYVSKHNR